MKFNAASIVVDADVARAAGETEHPVSGNARTVLLAILDAKLKITHDHALKQEWDKHASSFSRKWLASMISRRQFLYLKATPAVCAALIEAGKLGEKDRQIAHKDQHIVDLALATDQFIASNDTTARMVFATLAQQTPMLDQLCWMVPTEAAQAFANLLAEGGYVPQPWLLRPAS